MNNKRIVAIGLGASWVISLIITIFNGMISPALADSYYGLCGLMNILFSIWAIVLLLREE